MDIHPLSLKDQRIQRIIRIQSLIKYPLIHLQFLFNLSPHYIHNLTKMNHLLLMIKTYPQFDLISLTPSIENNRLTIFAFIFFIVTFYLTELYVIFYLVCFCYFYGLFFYLAGVVFLLIQGYLCVEDVLALGVQEAHLAYENMRGVFHLADLQFTYDVLVAIMLSQRKPNILFTLKILPTFLNNHLLRLELLRKLDLECLITLLRYINLRIEVINLMPILQLTRIDIFDGLFY